MNAGQIPGGFGNRSLSAGNQDTQRADAKARAKAEADAAKRAKELLALQKKSQIAEKNKLSLSKAAAVFDTQRVSLAAALKATYDKETRLRLEALIAIEEDNGDLALRKIGELAALQKNADLAKLAGVKEISDATLLAINTQLLTELTAINSSKMAEGDKELAREEAFKKYNAAIVAAGQLAAKESYSERIQIQLTEIARLASLSKTTSAATTATLLRESAELSMIDRVAKAQKLADDARLKALQDYIKLLDSIAAATTLSAMGSPQLIPSNTTNFTKSNPIIAALAKSVDFSNADVQTNFDKAIEAGATLPAAVSGSRYEAQARAQYEITINAGVGDPEAIARAVEDIFNQSSYRGTSTNRNTGLYIT
jgi:hypothetical protein